MTATRVTFGDLCVGDVISFLIPGGGVPMVVEDIEDQGEGFYLFTLDDGDGTHYAWSSHSSQTVVRHAASVEAFEHDPATDTHVPVKFYEATCDRCGEIFNPESPFGIVHMADVNGRECGGGAIPESVGGWA